MTKQQDTLRIVGTFLLKLAAAHAPLPPAKEFKLMADLCFLALPIKYRLTALEFEDAIKPWKRENFHAVIENATTLPKKGKGNENQKP